MIAAAVTSPLYLVPCPIRPDARLDVLSVHLSPAVTKRIAGFRTAEQRNQTILGRALLALAVADAGHPNMDLASLGIRGDGGPCVPEGYGGSISHTEGIVGALARRGFSLGLDLEHRRSGMEKLSNLSPAQPCLHHQNSCDCTLREWVAREAVAKAASAPLEEVLKAPMRNAVVNFRGGFPVHTFDVSDDVLAAVAGRNLIARPTEILLTLSLLLDRLQSQCKSSKQR